MGEVTRQRNYLRKVYDESNTYKALEPSAEMGA